MDESTSHPSTASGEGATDGRTAGAAHVSGVLVRAHASGMEQVASALSQLPGVELHQQEPATGRLVVTLETESVSEHDAGLARIAHVAGVIAAELVYHHVAGSRAGSPSSGLA